MWLLYSNMNSHSKPPRHGTSHPESKSAPPGATAPHEPRLPPGN